MAPSGSRTTEANEHANGDWIAYLGHDDIWYPTHLEAVLRTARREAADAVPLVMILYWPEATRGCRAYRAGLFATETYTSLRFVPPSAFAHARAIYGDVVKWRYPATVTLPMDVAFIDELARKGRKFAQTRELTCFKFNAAWRRDIYKLQAVASRSASLRQDRERRRFPAGQTGRRAAGGGVEPLLCDRCAADRRHQGRRVHRAQPPPQGRRQPLCAARAEAHRGAGAFRHGDPGDAVRVARAGRGSRRTPSAGPGSAPAPRLTCR